VAPDVGHARVPSVAGPVDIEWSVDALADVDRFATFLHDQFPELAARIAGELITRTAVLRRHPQLGRPLGNRHEYREIVLMVLGGTYAPQYRYDGSSVLILSVFHGRERR
jgi:plasmid stabilization system protein ParE